MDVEGCPLPDDRRYDPEGEVWVAEGPGPGVLTVGITAVLAAYAGKLLSVRYRDLEGPVGRGSNVATLESVRYTGPVRLPVSGRIRERNEAVVRRPKLVNDAPYAEGWIVRIEPEDGQGAPPALLTSEAVRPAIVEKIRSWRVRCLPAVPDVEVIEIGSECAAVLARVDEEIARLGPNEILLLVADDPTSPIEMVRWQDRTGHAVLDHRVEGAIHRFLIRREAHPRPRRRSERSGAIGGEDASAAPQTKGPTVSR
jgi:glycine cleavage system H protein